MTAFLNSAKGFIRSFVETVPPTDMEDDVQKKGLFAQCNFVVVRSAKLGDEEAKQVRLCRISSVSAHLTS